MRIRFHLDENVNSVIADALRAAGIDVTVPSEAGLIGAEDLEHLEFCRSEKRVIVTHDGDFLRLNRSGFAHWGIAYSPSRRRTPSQIIKALTLLWETCEADDMQNCVEYL
jgi:uncharacterized protein with PIN domain